jgi:hypothetical protein
MNKHLIYIIGGTVLLLVLTIIMVPIYDNGLHEQRDLKNPNYLSSYSNTGYYAINPETILTSLNSGDVNVFMPLLKDPRDITEDVTDITISWTQADFQRIASALSRLVWDDPIDAKDWNIYFVSFGGSCSDPVGFFSATITYFKTGRTAYITRLIEVNPYLGFVGWGDGANYPKPILQKWNSVDLFKAKFTADDVLRIVSEDAKERFQLKDNCGGLMGTPQNRECQEHCVNGSARSQGDLRSGSPIGSGSRASFEWAWSIF